MNLLQDILNYMRRILKTASDDSLTDALLIDYVNRFWLMDVDARIQLFDRKVQYVFQTTPGIDKYNMPLYSVQTEPGSQTISSFPVYQGFSDPCFVNGIQVPFYTQKSSFYNIWPNYVQSLNPAGFGDGTTGPYDLTLPFFPAITGHVDLTGIVTAGVADPPVVSTLNLNIPTTSVEAGVFITSVSASSAPIIVSDSGQFLSGNQGYGLLMTPGQAPFGNSALSGGYSITSNTVNYDEGTLNVTFPTAIPDGEPINVQCYFYEQGIPRAILFYNNVLYLRPPPNISYRVELEAYLTPAAFLTTSSSVPFGYMSEYLARGAARKMLSDTGDWEQFRAYEPLFIEQERLVWKRSQRQFTATRTGTIFSEMQGQNNNSNIGST